MEQLRVSDIVEAVQTTLNSEPSLAQRTGDQAISSSALAHLFSTVLGRLSIAHKEQSSSDDADELVAWAEMLVDHTADMLQRTPFKEVSVETRMVYMLAAACKAAAHLHALQPQSLSQPPQQPSLHNGTATSATVDLQQQQQQQQQQPDVTHLRRSLQALDKGLLVSGGPVARDRIEAWIHALQARILAVAPDPLLSVSPPISLAPPSSRACTRARSLAAHIDSLPTRIPRLATPPSLSDFSSHLRQMPVTPILIQGAIDYWPALSERPWTDLGYLLQKLGPDRLVPVEIGKDYVSDDWTQRLVSVSEFMHHIVDHNHSSDEDDDNSKSGDRHQDRMYLAQHNLIDQIPELRADIDIPDYCAITEAMPANAETESNNDDVIINTWFGPPDTLSPLHTDPNTNLFSQVVGYKYIRLYAPSETHRVYPHESTTMLSNTSQVAVESPDLDRFPLFKDAAYHECVIGPGEMLLIPRGWWHYVRSLSTSISISFWF